MNQAWELLFEGKINEAKQLVQAEFCLTTCKDYSLLNLMGYIYLYEKKYEHCLEVYQRYLHLAITEKDRENEHIAYHQLAMVYREMNDFQTVAGLEWIQKLIATEPDLSGLTVHLKIDSGMGRIGFRSASEAEQAQTLLKEHGANVEGIFTHFATADEESDSYFKQQLECFKEILAGLQEVPELVHASNSATTLWHAETIFNAVRMGDSMYGLNPSGQVLELPYELKPALTLETAIVHIKTVEAGACMGYGATYQADSEQVIATLPIGYADGWTRDMQNFSVLVDGQLCPIVGRVSMDQITVRLPKLYPLGTKVTLIGSNGDKEITATDVAVYRGTINYEVVCLLSDRVPREYY